MEAIKSYHLLAVSDSYSKLRENDRQAEATVSVSIWHVMAF